MEVTHTIHSGLTFITIQILSILGFLFLLMLLRKLFKIKDKYYTGMGIVGIPLYLYWLLTSAVVTEYGGNKIVSNYYEGKCEFQTMETGTNPEWNFNKLIKPDVQFYIWYRTGKPYINGVPKDEQNFGIGPFHLDEDIVVSDNYAYGKKGTFDETLLVPIDMKKVYAEYKFDNIRKMLFIEVYENSKEPVYKAVYFCNVKKDE